MAPAVLKYVFAALLALSSTQAVVPSTRVIAGIEILYSTQAEKQAIQKTVSRPQTVFIQQVAFVRISNSA